MDKQSVPHGDPQHEWNRECPFCLAAWQRHLRLRRETCFLRACEPGCPHDPARNKPQELISVSRGEENDRNHRLSESSV